MKERPQLTHKQEMFCVSYIETGNASESYRRAYNVKSMKAPTVNRKAKELIDNGKIAARLVELRKPVLERAEMTLESHLQDLKRLRDLAEEDMKWNAAIQAEIARGKASGLYVEKVEVDVVRGLADRLKEARERAKSRS